LLLYASRIKKTHFALKLVENRDLIYAIPHFDPDRK